MSLSDLIPWTDDDVDVISWTDDDDDVDPMGLLYTPYAQRADRLCNEE